VIVVSQVRARENAYTPLADVEALEAAGVNVVRYPDAEHGFAHAPERPSHRPADAADAFSRARTWLTTITPAV
jgi:dienelactone hydrolase